MIDFTSIESQWIIGFVLNFILILIGHRAPLLTSQGWIHAGALGTILWGCLGWKGWFAVVLYLGLGSLVTKIGYAYKQSIGIAEGRGGKRGPENVWGSATTGTFLAILIGLNVHSYELLLVGFSASFAAKLADTFGSEIGKRWGRKTYLITTLRPVPAGTDGGISFPGTLASVVGSLLMTFVMSILSFIPNSYVFLIVFLSGFLATLLESFLGAVCQRRLNWLSNEFINFIQTGLAALIAMFFAYRTF